MSAIKLPTGKACIAKIGPSAKSFHKGSFRLVPIPGPKNSRATVLVGCPITADRTWSPNKGRRITDRQGVERMIIGVCEYNKGPDKGKGATRGYLKMQQPAGGRCRKGYELKDFAAFVKQGKKRKK